MESIVTYELLEKEYKDHSDETTLRQINSMINSRLFELNFAKRFGLKCINAEGYDVVNEHGIEFELKYVGYAGDKTEALTIGNLEHKKNIILYVNKGIFDEKEHWYFFPGTEFNRVYGLNRHEWAVMDSEDRAAELSWNRAGNSYPKMMVERFKRTGEKGKALISRNKYNSSWKHNYLSMREFTVNQIQNIVKVKSEAEFGRFIYFDHTLNEVDELCGGYDEYFEDYADQ